MTLPLVSIAIACKDEEAHITGCIRSVQAQDWPPDRLEILVADGMSVDATREVLDRLAAEDGRIRLIDNPARLRATGLNECIRCAGGEIVIGMDVRADYGPDFVRQCVTIMDRTGADHVGGTAHARATTFFQRCVAAALRSPLAMSGPNRKGPDGGILAGVWPGAFRRSVFERAGLFDPKAITSEDAELNQRLVDVGGRVSISHDIVSHYCPRDSLRSLARQYYEYGKGQARTLVKHRHLPSVRPTLPFWGLIGEALLLAVAPIHLGGLSLAAYAVATGVEAVRVGRSEGVAAIPVVWAIFPVLHGCHGAGFGVGLVKYAVWPDWNQTERLGVPV
jgi:succinoglycan biosynthesis protein ExoA